MPSIFNIHESSSTSSALPLRMNKHDSNSISATSNASVDYPSILELEIYGLAAKSYNTSFCQHMSRKPLSPCY